MVLEFDIDEGRRLYCDFYIFELVVKIIGVEVVCVVNNNVVVVLLMLVIFVKDKEVIVLRGELVEIGGVFCIFDIML